MYKNNRLGRFFAIGMLIFYMNASQAAFNEGIHTYSKAAHLNPTHKQKIQLDMSLYENADNLWDALREEFTLNHYEHNLAVQERIQWFMRNQEYLIRAATRARPYLYYILQQVHKRHLPAELVLLPIIESQYNPFSISNMGAAGIWQLMPGTATGYGVRQDWWFDGRKDVISSTRGALNYLAYLQSFFDGNWLLAIAAYNTGEGNVLSAIKRNLRNGINSDFWTLPLAQQTRDYVPSLLALAIIISHPMEYPLYFPPVKNAPYLAQIDIGTQINLKYAALLAGLSYPTLMELNSGFMQISTSARGPHRLILPIENALQFMQNYERLPLQLKNSWVQYKVRRGDSLISLSKKFKINFAELKRFNHLNSPNLPPGSLLLIPSNGVLASANNALENPNREFYKRAQAILMNVKNKKVMQRIAKLSQKKSIINYSVQPGDTVYMVRRRESLDDIAKRFATTTNILRVANGLSNNSVFEGKQLVIPTHIPTTVATKSQSPSEINPGDTIYMVRKGDTVEKIANKFKTAPANIRLANLVNNDSLIEGEKLIIPTHIAG